MTQCLLFLTPSLCQRKCFPVYFLRMWIWVWCRKIKCCSRSVNWLKYCALIWICALNTLWQYLLCVCGRFVLQLCYWRHICCVCQGKLPFCTYTMSLNYFCQTKCLLFICLMAFIILRVCFFGSVEHIKSRSDLRDQFRSTLVGFGKSWSFWPQNWSEAALNTTALSLLHLDVVLFCIQRTYEGNLCCKHHLPFHKDGALGIPPTINFLGRDLTAEFMTNYRIVGNHSRGSSHQVMSELW